MLQLTPEPPDLAGGPQSITQSGEICPGRKFATLLEKKW